jgi:uncharacterized membrane protein
MVNDMDDNRASAAVHQQDRQDPAADGQNTLPDIHAVAPEAIPSIVVGVFEEQASAEAAIGELERAGFRHADISLVMRQPESLTDPIGHGKTKADQGAVTGVSAGAVLGGLAGLAALAIPGVGALLAAGPIAVALGAMSGAALGGLVGSFTGLGIPSAEAEELGHELHAGRVVLAVKVADRAEEARARATLQHHQPRRVNSFSQAT